MCCAAAAMDLAPTDALTLEMNESTYLVKSVLRLNAKFAALVMNDAIEMFLFHPFFEINLHSLFILHWGCSCCLCCFFHLPQLSDCPNQEEERTSCVVLA